VSFNHTGSSLLTLDTQGDTRIWDAQTCHELTQLVGHRSTVVAADFSLGDHYVVTAGRDRSARIFSLPDGTEQATLLGHTEALQSVAFSPDGTKVVSTSSDGTARLWDAANGRPIGSEHTPLRPTGRHRPGRRHPRERGADGDVRLWNLGPHRPVTPIETGVALDDVTFSRTACSAAQPAPTDPRGPGTSRATGSSPSSHSLSRARAPLARRHVARNGRRRQSCFASSGFMGGKDWSHTSHTSAVHDVAPAPMEATLRPPLTIRRAQIWSWRSGRSSWMFVGHWQFVNSVAFSS
jgi:WD40 repeat protein